VPLEEWLSIMVQAENLLRTRRHGLCYINDLTVPGMLMQKVGIDVNTFVNEYYDYDRYND
jgi:hypothetical protein